MLDNIPYSAEQKADPEIAQIIQAEFNRLDSNKDGFISESDLLKMNYEWSFDRKRVFRKGFFNKRSREKPLTKEPLQV